MVPPCQGREHLRRRPSGGNHQPEQLFWGAGLGSNPRARVQPNVVRVIGIDLGTTNTVVATKNKVREIDPAGGAILPSVVAFPPRGERLVGSPARDRRSIDAENTIFSAKRIMGQRWHSPATKEFRNRYPFKLVETADGWPAFHTRAGDFTPPQI